MPEYKEYKVSVAVTGIDGCDNVAPYSFLDEDAARQYAARVSIENKNTMAFIRVLGVKANFEMDVLTHHPAGSLCMVGGPGLREMQRKEEHEQRERSKSRPGVEGEEV